MKGQTASKMKMGGMSYKTGGSTKKMQVGGATMMGKRSALDTRMAANRAAQDAAKAPSAARSARRQATDARIAAGRQAQDARAAARQAKMNQRKASSAAFKERMAAARARRAARAG